MEKTSHSHSNETLAPRILELCRRQLAQSIPALMLPLYLLREQPWPVPGPLATDGVHLFYCPEQVTADFRADRSALGHQMLHILLHCLLGHLPQRQGRTQPALFDALVDIRVGQLAAHLLKLDREWYDSDFDTATPLPELYRKVLQNHRLCRSVFRQGERYAVDNHTFWDPAVAAAKAGLCAKGQASEEGSTSGSSPAGAGSAESSEEQSPIPDWQGIAQDLLGQSGWGSLPAELEQALQPDRESTISYREFLRRFALSQERLLTDPDGLDSRWYCLGLELYGDIPLIEPPELSEPPLADNLVVAIDTSGSCAGEVMRQFLRETLQLLRDLTAGSCRCQVLMLQCDCSIQQELMLESADQVDSLLDSFPPQGFGGTDFRPVFLRVEELRQAGVLARVQGLLYISDGWGDFPDAPPDYPVSFLIPRDPMSPGFHPWVPSWVTTLYLDTDHYTVKEASA